MLKKWKQLGSKVAFENRWWKILQQTVELPDGTVTDDYFVNDTSGGVVIFAMTEGGKVVLNRQYKHGIGEIIEELTIGRLDGDDGGPLEEAKRELLEETGYGGGVWEPLMSFVSNPTSSTGRIHAFIARGVKRLAEQKKDPKEIVEVFEVEPAELLEKVRRGEIATHASIATIYLALDKLGKMKGI